MIQRATDGEDVIFSPSGRIEMEYQVEWKRLFESETDR